MNVVLGRAITQAKAAQRIKNGLDTITWFGHNAKKIVNKVKKGRKVLHHYKNIKFPMFKHYHIKGNRAHSAYLK